MLNRHRYVWAEREDDGTPRIPLPSSSSPHVVVLGAVFVVADVDGFVQYRSLVEGTTDRRVLS